MPAQHHSDAALVFGSPLARDYVEGTGTARDFFIHGPADFAAAIAERDAAPARPWTPDEIEEVARFNVNCGNTAGAGLAGALLDSRTLAVVTGQQPNLLASPTYNLLKALSACALADRLARDTRRAVIPVFWVGSDDHDFKELRDCHVLNADGTLANIGELVTRGAGTPAGSPAYAWRLGECAARLLDALRRALAAGPARESTLAAVADALARGPDGDEPGFESVFCRMLASCLGDQRILLLAPRLSCVRRRQAAIVRAEIGSAGASTDLVMARGRELEAAGYTAAIHRAPGALNVFYITQQVRARLTLTMSDGRIRAEDPASSGELALFAPSQLLAELDAHPERFSANVVTRPVVQDHVLPSIGYVGGPGEIAYLAQLAPLYAHFGVRASVVVARASATIVDRATMQALGALGLSPRDVLSSPGETMRRLAGQDAGLGPLLERLREFEASVAEGLRALEAHPLARHPHVEPAMRKTRSSMQFALNQLRGRLVRQARAHGGAHWAAVSRAQSLLMPLGFPQERVLSHLTFGATHSPAEVTAQLRAKLDFRSASHQMIELD